MVALVREVPPGECGEFDESAGREEGMTNLLDEPALKFVSPPPPEPSRQFAENSEPRRPERWPHPASEAERLTELEGFLAGDFDTFREVRIECQFLLNVAMNFRVDLLAVPKPDIKVCEWNKQHHAKLDEVVLAFEVKRDGFNLERALKQSADYVGGRVIEEPHKGKRIAACFLYPADTHQHSCWHDRYHAGMFQLIARWRVGRGYVHRDKLRLAFGQEVIWDSSRGLHVTVANRMLLGQRSFGGHRQHTPANYIELLSEELAEGVW